MKIKRGDEVKILTGKDRGKSGKVEKVLRDREKVVIAGLNLYKSHERARKGGVKGQVVEKSMPIHFSNVRVMTANTEKPARKKAKVEKKSE